MSAAGTLVAVGLGPGDPELITLKALRALQSARAVAYFAKAGNRSNALAIAAAHLRSDVPQLPLLYPVTTELDHKSDAYRRAICDFFDQSAATLARELDRGVTVAVICEGDPLFYGSYMHLHERLARHYRTEVVAGVTGMSGCWSSVGAPIAQGDDVFTVLPGTLAEEELARRIRDTDAAVIMKVGRNLPKVRRALARTGRLDRALYVERGTMNGAKAMRLADKSDDVAPYFAIVLVPGWQARRGSGAGGGT
jgi:precorrin-2/cobalt-factor-2 C20-methyltransferase